MSKDSDNVLLMKRLYWWLCFWYKNLLYSQAVLELTALLSQVFCCWNNRQVSPHLALHCLPSFFFKCGNYKVSWSMLNTSGKSVFLDNSFMHSMDNHSFMHSLRTSFIFAWLFLTLRLGELASRALYHNEKKNAGGLGWKQPSSISILSCLTQVESKPLAQVQKPSSKIKKLRMTRCSHKVGSCGQCPFSRRGRRKADGWIQFNRPFCLTTITL